MSNFGKNCKLSSLFCENWTPAKRGPKYPFLADSFGLVFIFFYHAQNSKSPLQIAGNFKDTGRRLCKEGLKKSPDLESGPKIRIKKFIKIKSCRNYQSLLNFW